MSTKLFCVAFSLLCAGHTDAVITQIPRHKITQTGKKVTLRCHQTDDYDYMYWYRQDLGSGLRLIYYSYGVGITEKGDVSDGYNVSRTNTKDFSLTLVSATTSQTSVYFCANSESTALHSCLLSAHKGCSGRLRLPVLVRPSPTCKVPASAGATGSLPARGSSCVGSVTFMPRPTPR